MRAYNKKHKIVGLPTYEDEAYTSPGDTESADVTKAREQLSNSMNDLLATASFESKWLEGEGDRNSIQRKSDQRMPSSADIALTVFDEIDKSNEFLARLGSEPSDANSLPMWSDGLAKATSRRMQEVASLVPTLKKWSGTAELLSVATFAEECRATLSLFHWLSSLAPGLANSLSALAWSPRGIQAIATEFPAFSGLLRHIMKFVEAQAKQSYRGEWVRAKSKGKGKGKAWSSRPFLKKTEKMSASAEAVFQLKVSGCEQSRNIVILICLLLGNTC